MVPSGTIEELAGGGGQGVMWQLRWRGDRHLWGVFLRETGRGEVHGGGNHPKRKAPRREWEIVGVGGGFRFGE